MIVLAFLARVAPPPPSSDDGSFPFLLVVGAIFGVGLFIRGFWLLRKERLISNTPRSRVRGAAIGLVELEGVPIGPYTINSPIQRKPTFAYRTVMWALEKQGGRRGDQSWKKVADERRHVRFYLQDRTGMVLVDPEEADLDLKKDFSKKWSVGAFRHTTMPPEVYDFTVRYNCAGESIRIEEYTLRPGSPVSVIGTLAVNEAGMRPEPHPLAIANAVAVDMTGVQLSGHDMLAAKIASIRVRVEDHHAPAAAPLPSIKDQLLKPGHPRSAQAVAAIAAKDPGLAAAVAQSLAAKPLPPPAPPKPAGGPWPPEDRTIVVKGENDPTFLISWRTRRQLVLRFMLKALLYVVAGPALTIFCVWALLKTPF